MQEMDDSVTDQSSIKRIDKSTVHNICSGQVITNLRSAVKELVENSLDAGANTVEIHLYDHGTTSIEVIDNGSGIRAEDFEAVGLKHHTSKLREFADLPGVGTFGFRGEALGSLCALADVSIVTRHRAASVGTRLKLDAAGRISHQGATARQVGTTVTVRQLFNPLPVRRRQFCGRARREVTDLLHLLWGYALISSDVRLLCTQQCTDGRRTVLLSSPAGAALPDRVAALFGQKQAATLLPLRPTPPSEATRAEFGLTTPAASAAAAGVADVRVEGLVSSCEHGKGRGAADRQFVSINGRPCDHVKICRLVNEVYRTYNRHQSPFLALAVTLGRDKVDVNVTPDKRLLFIQNEKHLLACVKEALTQCFESLPSSYRVTSLTASQSPSSPSVTSPCVTSSPCLTPTAANDWISSIKRSVKKTSAPATDRTQSKRQCLDRFFRRLPTSPTAPGGCTEGGDGDSAARPPPPPPTTTAAEPDPANGTPACVGDPGAAQTVATQDGAGGAVPSDGGVMCVELPADGEGDAACARPAVVTGQPPPPPPGTGCLGRLGAGDGIQTPQGAENSALTAPNVENDAQEYPVEVDAGLDRATVQGFSSELFLVREPSQQHPAPADVDLDRPADGGAGTTSPTALERISSSDSGFAESSQLAEADPSGRRRVRMAFSMDELRRQVAELESQSSDHDDRGQKWRFRATIKPSDNQAAEEELSLQIKKEDFLKMQMVGQFNLGFLVTRLGRDLFLIDQHASDEKFNFERLSRQPLTQQPLVVPQQLELPAVSEETLLSQPEVFSAAGFSVAEDVPAPPGRRLRLTAAPAVQGVVCGKADLEELIWLVQESPGPLTALRPSRVRAVLASRACRSSVMIGTALSAAGMRRLVHNMAQMEHPWNCPHGRPTMRHLVCLGMLQS